MSDIEGIDSDFTPYGGSELPDGTIVVNTYKRYREMIDRWIEGKFESTLIVVGAAGVGKSETALRGFEAQGKVRGDNAGNGDFCYIKGKATQRSVYEYIVKFKDKPIVIDDTDELLADNGVSALLKMLLETSETKIVQWSTKNTMSDDSSVPSQVETKSHTMIFANELKQVTKNFSAVLDRSTVLYFAPKADEVHEYVKTWWDMKSHKDIYQHMGKIISAVASPSCRFYVKAKQWKNAGLPWEEMINAAVKPKDKRQEKMLELINKYMDANKKAYVTGGVSKIIAEYMEATNTTKQAAYQVKAAVRSN